MTCLVMRILIMLAGGCSIKWNAASSGVHITYDASGICARTDLTVSGYAGSDFSARWALTISRQTAQSLLRDMWHSRS